MANNQNEPERDERERAVLKYTTSENLGIEPIRLTRNAIGFIIRGEKYIHDDEQPLQIAQGEIFILNQGTHYIENTPTKGGTFEQITFYISPARLQQIIASIDTSGIDLNAEIGKSQLTGAAKSSPSKIMRNIFLAANRHFEYGGFLHDQESERIFLMSIVYSILTQSDSTIKNQLLKSLDREKAEFEKIIYSNLLNDKSVDELAAECSRSLTSFKKEFKRIFGTPPHQWYLRQRLNYSKLLLDTTRDSISNIGITCAFPNTSHFIKLFKRNFGYTPAVYRATHREEVVAHN